MPRIRCCSCKRLQNVQASDWKLCSCLEEHVCSCDCVSEWIKSQESRLDSEWRDWAVPNPDWSAKPQFRSLYEERFAIWLDRNGFCWAYEPFIFAVGTGSYRPDFYMPTYGAFIELKGKWGVGQKTKLRKFVDQYTDLPILVVPWMLAEEIYANVCSLRLG